MHNRIIIILCLMFMVLGEMTPQNTIIANYGSCIDYAPKVCLLMSGQCFDIPCPDCTCRIWLSDSKGKNIVNGATMTVSGAKTCCYIAKAPLVQGQTYTGFFNAVSPSYGEGNDTGSIYVTSTMGATMGVSQTSNQPQYNPTITAIDYGGPNSGKNYCTTTTKTSCEYLATIDCITDKNLEFTQRLLCFGAKAGCVVNDVTSSGTLDAGACFLKFLGDLVNLLIDSLGAILGLLKAIITFILGIASADTREQAISDALEYTWGFAQSLLYVLAPIIVVAEFVLIYKNASGTGMSAVSGFIRDNMQFFGIVANVLNFILGVFIDIVSMFYNLIFGVKPK